MIKVIFLTLALALSAHAKTVDRIVATVNGEIITSSDIVYYKKQLKNGSLTDDLLVKDKKALLKDSDKLLQSLIDEKLIDSEVKKLGLSVTIEKVEDEIRNISRRNGINRSGLKKALKEQGVRFSDYQGFIKKRLERQTLIERVVSSKIKISDDDIAAYYVEHKGASGKETYEYKISHILFLPKGGDVKSAESRGKTVLEKLEKGENFEDLAAKYSEDPNFSTGGFLGDFKSGESLPEIDKAIKEMSLNQTSKLIKSRIGFHILKLNNRKLVTSPEFEKAKEKIRTLLYQESFQRQFSFWLEQKREDSFIRINKKRG